MPNLRTQDVHTYITELLTEVFRPAETDRASAQPDPPSDAAIKEKPIRNATDHHSIPVRSTKLGG